MASDKKQFHHAVERWRNLGEQEQFSLPLSVGRWAIMAAYDTVDDSPKEIRRFRNEALVIAKMLQSRGLGAFAILQADYDDFSEILADTTICSVITVGHGTLSSFFVQRGDNVDGMIDWQDVANMTTHLKSGIFVQRHCGVMSRDLNVPLGTFAMSDHRNVIAPVGQYFFPYGLLHPENNKLHRVTDRQLLKYEFVKKSLAPGVMINGHKAEEV